MVKPLDDKSAEPPDHVGWLLWRAGRAWEAAFVAAMREAGHDWFTHARAALMAQLDRRGGVAQSRLIEAMGISKQAVQQLIDGLVAEGVLVRAADPDDRRGRLVRYTEKGTRALRDADAIKLRIEADYRRRLGRDRFAALTEALALLG